MDKKIKKGLAVGALIGGAVAGFAMSNTGRKLGKKIAIEAEDLYTELSKKAGMLADMSKEKYEELAERIGEEYAKKKQMAVAAQKDLVKKLKAKWVDYQVDALYRELQKSFKRIGDKSKEAYTTLVEEVVVEYGKQKKLAGAMRLKLERDLKARWKEIQEKNK
jgi:gas vesicle protein